jgi:hypothetical protein
VQPHAAGWYPAIANALGIGGNVTWRWNWLYIPNMVPVLPSFTTARPRGRTGVMGLFPLAVEVADVPALVGAVDALRGQGLTGPVIIRTFIE